MDRVIFYLGDEGGVDGEAGKKIVSIRVPEGGLEGLRIVIRNGGKRSNATTSMLVRPPGELGFLESCCLCRRELDPCKDVYMGDQGFCSDECRSRRILLDERRELEATARDRVKGHRRRRHRRHRETPNKISEPDLNRRISAAV
ncbi:FCS-Like Zinc finger 17-like isoform X2 [Zingiber officinale]|uniref:FCS-Like Zinc finger 17-like isoform X2 n=1 Tax=Zingiber officinale TaxID=94328 RepID=UPI001C4AED92|nr:FCS-Like Zinc finger 17-like isoform X2 [Zingiber officinale]